LARLRLLSLFAWHQWQLGRQRTAINLLEQALALANQTGYIRSILDVPGLEPLLVESSHPIAAGLLRCIEQENRLDDLARLTPKERTVLELLANDEKYREIADKLNISMDTVRFHVRNIYRKLGVNRRMEAVQHAQIAGIIKKANPV
jgi:LuxR family maltose regulon positive regulatory protein